MKTTIKKKKNVVVAVSGGFDPVHVGHIQMFARARKLGDELVVILNNDNWLMKKKGYVFMPQKERKELLESIRYVDRVIFTKHKKDDPDRSICKELRALHPDVFGNGGDRKAGNTPELDVCKELGIKTAFGLGTKVQSSSWLVGKIKEAATQSKK